MYIIIIYRAACLKDLRIKTKQWHKVCVLTEIRDTYKYKYWHHTWEYTLNHSTSGVFTKVQVSQQTSNMSEQSCKWLICIKLLHSHTLHGSFAWSNNAGSMAHIPVAKQTVLLRFQDRWVNQLGTAYSWGNYLARIERGSARTLFSLAIKAWKAVAFTYLPKSRLWCWPKRRWSGNAAQGDLFKVRLPWSCSSRTGHNRCKKARGKECIAPDYASLEWLCKSILRHTSANLALSCRKAISLHQMKSKIRLCPSI